MTQATEILTPPRTSESKLVGGVCLAHLVSHYYMVLLAPLFVFIKDDYGVSYTELGLALTAFNMVSTVMQTPVGFFVDRTGARINLIGGLLLGSAAVAVAGLVDSFWVFIAMYAVMGLANTVYHPADYTLLSEHVSPKRITQVLSYHTCAGMAGSAIAPVTLLFMQTLVGWRGAFLCAAILGVIAALILAMLDEGPAHHKVHASKPHANETTSAPADGWRLLLSPPILLNLVFFIVLSMVGGGLNQYLVVGLGALYGTPPAIANTALTGLLAMSAIGVLVGGVLAARTARHNLVASAGLLVTGCVAMLIGLVDPGAVLLGLGRLPERFRERHDHALARHDRARGDPAGLVRQGVRIHHHGLPYRWHGGAVDLRAIARSRPSACGVLLHRGLRTGGDHHRRIRDVEPARHDSIAFSGAENASNATSRTCDALAALRSFLLL